MRVSLVELKPVWKQLQNRDVHKSFLDQQNGSACQICVYVRIFSHFLLAHFRRKPCLEKGALKDPYLIQLRLYNSRWANRLNDPTA